MSQTEMRREIAPFGTWESPITTETLSGKSLGLSEVAAHEASETIYHLEVRPTEGGRGCIVEHTADGPRDVTPKEYNVRSGVHEYGGGAFTVGVDGTIIFSDFNTSGVFSVAPGTREIKPVVKADKKIRYADFDVHPTTPQWVLAVKEDHHVSEPENSLVVIDTATQSVHTIARGADFYGQPRFRPDGAKICWIQWNHPDMPWTGTVLYVAEWTGTGPDFLVWKTEVAGKAEEISVSQPRWGIDGKLFFVDDRTGFWQLYRLDEGESEARAIKLKPYTQLVKPALENAEFAGPEWVLGRFVLTLSLSHLQRLTDPRLIVARTS